jgi:flagellar biosynthesis GTPase FlhF
MKYLFSSKKEGSDYPNLGAFLVCQIGIHRNSIYEHGIIYRKETELINLVQELWQWQFVCSGKSLIEFSALGVKQADATSLVTSIFKTEATSPSSRALLESARRVAKEETATLLLNAFQSVAKEFTNTKKAKKETTTASDSSKEKKLGRPKLTPEQKEERRKKRELEEMEQKKQEEKEAKRKQKEQQEEEKESKRAKIVVEKTKKKEVKEPPKKQKKTTFIPSEVACGDSDSN